MKTMRFILLSLFLFWKALRLKMLLLELIHYFAEKFYRDLEKMQNNEYNTIYKLKVKRHNLCEKIQ